MRFYTIFLSALLVLGCCNSLCLCAQNIIADHPYVGSSYCSAFGSTSIKLIETDNRYTYVYIKYRPNNKTTDIAISISSNTTLTTDRNEPMKIISWGISKGTWKIPLEFDKAYSWESESGIFYLVFPKISSGLRNATISENIQDGFYWHNITLSNNNRHGDSSKEDNAIEGGNTFRSHQPQWGDNTFTETIPNKLWKNDNQQSDHFTVNASGSGFALKENGIIATCYHVIENARRIRIRGINGDFNTPLYAEVIAIDRANDLAILKVSDINFSHINSIPYNILSETSDVGESVLVLGYPLRAVMGDEIKLTNGIISAHSGFQGDTTEYQISAIVQSGNSGCPVFNQKGDAIGVVNARLQLIEGASYAIKGKYLNNLLSTLPIADPIRKNNVEVLPITEIAKNVKSFIYIIEVE